MNSEMAISVTILQLDYYMIDMIDMSQKCLVFMANTHQTNKKGETLSPHSKHEILPFPHISYFQQICTPKGEEI